MALSFDPIDSLLRLQKDIDRYFGTPQFDFGISGPNVFPQINVFRSRDGAVVVRAEVPGIRPADVHVEVELPKSERSRPRRIEVRAG